MREAAAESASSARLDAQRGEKSRAGLGKLHAMCRPGETSAEHVGLPVDELRGRDDGLGVPRASSRENRLPQRDDLIVVGENAAEAVHCLDVLPHGATQSLRKRLLVS